MRKLFRYAILTIIISLILLPILLFSDDAPMQPTQSGNVMPAYNSDIKMKNERIDIYLRSNNYSVEVNYTFVNRGKKQDVIMGFPNVETEYGIYVKPIKGFEAYDGKEKMKIFRKDADDSFYKVKKYIDLFPGYKENEYDLILSSKDVFFECFETTFENGETKHIVNKYTQDYFVSYNAIDRYFAYILKSGSFWKGDIDNIDVYIHLDRIPESERKKQIVYEISDESFSKKKKEYKKVVYEWKIKPEGAYNFKDDVIEMHFEDVEPDFNIEVTFPMPIISSVSASSTLESKSDRYSPSNVLDCDPTTAWVEGVKGDGIGESLRLSVVDVAGRWPARVVEKIGIVSGYAKNKDIFYKNNRPKKIKITLFTRFNSKKYVTIHTLKDTMDMQYIEFNKKSFINNFEIEILSVYKGSKYDDTCISDVIAFTGELD